MDRKLNAKVQGPWGRAVSRPPLGSGKGKERASPPDSEGTQPGWHLDFRTSDLQNWKMINLCCFKSRSSSSFVTAVIRKVMCHPLTLPDMSACHRRVRATEPLAHQRDRLLPPANSSSRGGVHTQHRGTQLLFHTFPCNTLTLHSPGATEHLSLSHSWL